MTKRLALAVAAATLCFPASSLAASSAGVILSVHAKHHALQFVDSRHVVRAYHFRGRLPGVALGSRVSIRYSGHAIKHVRVRRGLATQVSFLGTITQVRAHGFVVQLGDRTRLRFAATAIRSVSRRHRLLTRGAVVLITETFSARAHGAPAVSVKSVGRSSATTSGAGGSGSGASGPGGGTATGTIVELDAGALVVQTSDGSTLRFTVVASSLATLQPSLCDAISVSYHQAGTALVADNVQSSDASAIAACNNAGSGGGTGATGQQAVGTVTQMTLTTLTISTAGGGSLAFNAGLDLTLGFVLGDQVDVTYNPSGGTQLAVDLSYQSQDAIGAVTSVSAGSVTIVISATNQAQTFTDDPLNGTFDGVSIGDQIDVTYHLSSAQTVVDSVGDLTNPL